MCCHTYNSKHVERLTFKSLIKTRHLAVVVSASSDNTFFNVNLKRRKCVLFDVRSHNIDRLRYFIASYDWSCVLNGYGVNMAYFKFLSVIGYLIRACIPVSRVTVGTRDLLFVTPFIKKLLRKRYVFCGKGRTDVLAEKNILIVKHRSKTLINLRNSSTKPLWQTVNANNS
jgi:hypothetical protein